MRRNWTHKETIVALNLFCTIPFNECRATHPIIKEVSLLIGRSPAALNMKIGNFGRLDSTLAARGVTGLKNGSTMDKTVWDEFYGNFEELALESEEILTQLRQHSELQELPEGKEIEVKTKKRINQDFFRRMVLSSYNFKCCITGVSDVRLLEACHISDWSQDIDNRTNPHNGLSMTPTLHKAYDNMLLAVTPDYQIVVSEKLMADTNNAKATADFFKSINGSKITMPDRFAPSRELLDQHYQKYNEQCH